MTKAVQVVDQIIVEVIIAQINPLTQEAAVALDPQVVIADLDHQAQIVIVIADQDPPVQILDQTAVLNRDQIKMNQLKSHRLHSKVLCNRLEK